MLVKEKMEINDVTFNKCIPKRKGIATQLMQSSFSNIMVFLTRFEGLKLT